ncbi:homoserine kinase [Heyndrickxia acidicola]|uniref:Homoserine kinase n=1 Tax=Heyndrickxia acidicola TaxID=209389 RepID=A0ABU6MF70_9BACI|nr:homoserine kinase [Heyndrickxia acidicola]MED1201690.1 homoserine kinase [Heyndrickxia acidicola]
MMHGCEKYTIKVPASTANLGPGFDSLGLALDLYLTIEVEKSDKWKVISFEKELGDLPTDEQHFICQTAFRTAKQFNGDLPPCSIKILSHIPLAKGLGSSAAAIVAGIELANHMANLQLSTKQKLEMATELEGHPDNAGASLLGGLVVGSQLEQSVDIIKVENLNFEVIAVVPQTELFTQSARGVLPAQMNFSQAVKASAVSNTLVAALVTGNWEVAGKMMKNDCFHQPYRSNLVPHFPIVQEEALRLGAFGAALSGSGPTIVCFSEKGLCDGIVNGLTASFSGFNVLKLSIDNHGVRVVKEGYQLSGPAVI